MQGNFIPKNLKLPERNPAPKPRAKASSSGEHVQLFCMGFPSRILVGFSCFIACENMGVNLKFHLTNTLLCLHVFGNGGGG